MKVFIAFVAVIGIGVMVLYGLLGAGNSESSQSIIRGQAAYAANCASCHGVNLEGAPDWQVLNEDGTMPAPPHNNDGHTWHHDDRLLFDYTKLGGAQAMEARGLSDFKSGMPAFEGILSDGEINDIWVFIRSTWGEEERAAQAERTAMEIESNL